MDNESELLTIAYMQGAASKADEIRALRADAEELYLYAEDALCERADQRAEELRQRYAPKIRTIKPSAYQMANKKSASELKALNELAAREEK